ncbi:MAG: DUF3027 domain-containing protein [Microcella sp.]|uniref:DUF3027 domain-containing protein n=1 Tax=Microcella sp. TaxID=1913979 RepID=UPI0024C99687|nr:DUF3027 domain-containing protein [Microcella sp.]UYN83463.1 MAG: DUF3027 domain-containing protein [Microcella sp.]
MARATKKTAADPSGAADAATLEPLARHALAEITAAANVGALRDIVVADDVATVRFSTTQGGYPGWYWTVAIAVNPGMQPGVLETELIPAEGALTAPDWVPWADRLDDYLAQQALEREAAGDGDADDSSRLDSDDDDDDLHDEHDVHGDDGDDVFDGVDIDLHLDDESLTVE